jgi:hypothetical protein
MKKGATEKQPVNLRVICPVSAGSVTPLDRKLHEWFDSVNNDRKTLKFYPIPKKATPGSSP